MPELDSYIVDTRDYARRILREFDCDGAIEGSREELLVASALIQIEYAKHADKFWSRGCNRDFDFLCELAAITICESRSPCSYGSLRAMLRALYRELQNVDVDSAEPSPQERYQQTTAFCFLLAAVSEIKTQVAREENEELVYPFQTLGVQR